MLPPCSADGLGIYVHFPWCLKKCPYCDFLSVAVPPDSQGERRSVRSARAWLPHEDYSSAILNEWKARLHYLKKPLPELRSIFFGGGTPSLWRPSEIGKVIDALAGHYPGPVDPRSIEVTVECNPTSLDKSHAQELHSVGVNRLSIGVQNLDNKRLEFLGRLHDEADGLRAVYDALSVGVPQVSADLIYGIYSQNPDSAKADALNIAQTGINHLSAYSLTIEENTRFGALNAKGKLPLLDDALAAQSFETVSAALQEEGFIHYEISNFCKEGAYSLHNLGYWQGRDYLGLGAGAFGTVSLAHERIRYRNSISPERYLSLWARAQPSKDPKNPHASDPFSENLSERELITPSIAHQESFLLGLRTIFGVDTSEMASLRGGDPLPQSRRSVLRDLVAQGRIVEEGSRLRIPPEHWLFADGIIRQLL